MLATQGNSAVIETQTFLSPYAFSFEERLLHADVVIGPDDSDPLDPKAIFQQFTFAYILSKVRGLLWSLIPPGERGLFDEENIAAEIYNHFWEVLADKARKPIRYPTTYLASMIHNKVYDELRKHNRQRAAQSFSGLGEAAAQEVNAMQSWSLGMCDPACEYERKHHAAHFLHRLAFAVSKLPPRQKLAMTCELLEKADNLSWMTDALIIYGVDTSVRWPKDKKAKQGLQANLPAAHLAVANYLGLDLSSYLK